MERFKIFYSDEEFKSIVDLEKKTKWLEEYSNDFNKFIDKTSYENYIQVILRGHIYIENELNKLLELELKFSI